MLSLPATPITLAVRSDSSGTTANFTKFLVEAAGSAWPLGTGSTVNWPAGAGGASGNSGVAQIVKSTPGAIGYVDYATAKASGLTFASVKNKDGNYVAPSPASAAAGREPGHPHARRDVQRGLGGRGQLLPDHLPVMGPGLRQAAERERREACSRRTSGTCSETARSCCPDLGYAPLPASIDQQALAQLSKIGVVSGE